MIKEVRSITNLGLTEVRRRARLARTRLRRPPLTRATPTPPTPQATELVEGAPCMMMQKVKREDALKMIEKLKADTGAECELV